jgi:hypothetical protein
MTQSTRRARHVAEGVVAGYIHDLASASAGQSHVRRPGYRRVRARGDDRAATALRYARMTTATPDRTARR